MGVGAVVIPELDHCQQMADPSGTWFVLRTRSRHEKILADDLVARGIKYFLPLVNCVRYYGQRKARVTMPLFPGYLFLRGTLEQAYEADRTHRVAQIIPVANQDQINWELRNISIAITNKATLDPYPYLREGLRVEVRSGPFRGLQGIIEDRTRGNRLILQIEMLGRAAGLEIDAGLLDLVE
jgi:transcription termination/antitermination protein NusG